MHAKQGLSLTKAPQANKLLSATSPWALVKSQEAKDRAQVTLVVYHVAECLRIAGILLQPFIPLSAAKLLDTLGVDQQHRTLPFAEVGKDFDYGIPLRPPGSRPHDSLFPPLAVEN